MRTAGTAALPQVTVAEAADVSPSPLRDFSAAANPAKPGAMYRNIFLVGGWTIASRLTGFMRDVALAALLGGGALNDAYVAAIKLPNQFRQIFGESFGKKAAKPRNAIMHTLAAAGAEAGEPQELLALSVP